MCTSAKSGFTLIELLVVVAIIAILAAILFPVFAQVREKARAVSCLSNERQLGLSVAQYVQDYDEQLPSGRISLLDTATIAAQHRGQGWGGQTQPYIKNTQIFKCPDDSTSALSGVYPISYFLNYNAANNALASFNAPARCVLIGEITGVRANVAVATELPNTNTPLQYSPAGNGLNILNVLDNGTNSTGLYDTGWLGYYSPPPTRFTFFKNIKGRHSDGGNFVFADYHAKFMRPSEVSPGAPATASTDNENHDTGQAAGSADQFQVTFSPN